MIFYPLKGYPSWLYICSQARVYKSPNQLRLGVSFFEFSLIDASGSWAFTARCTMGFMGLRLKHTRYSNTKHLIGYTHVKRWHGALTASRCTVGSRATRAAPGDVNGAGATDLLRVHVWNHNHGHGTDRLKLLVSIVRPTLCINPSSKSRAEDNKSAVSAINSYAYFEDNGDQE
jgi:hypothetical protein